MVFDDPAVVETTVLAVAVDTLDPADSFAEDKSERTEESADDTEDKRDPPEAELPDPDDPEDPDDDALILTLLRVNHLPPLMVIKTNEADNKISEVTGGRIVTTYNQYHTLRSYRCRRLQRINNSSKLSSDTPYQNPK
jgi:hypothetical protein